MTREILASIMGHKPRGKRRLARRRVSEVLGEVRKVFPDRTSRHIERHIARMISGRYRGTLTIERGFLVLDLAALDSYPRAGDNLRAP